MGIPPDGAHHTVVGVAAAEHAAKGSADLLVGCVGIGIEDGFRGEDDAAEAIAALGCSFVDKGLLDGVWLFGRAESFEGDDFVSADGAGGFAAGADWFAGDKDRAGAALGEATAEARPGEVEIVVEDVEERGFGIDCHLAWLAVYAKAEGLHGLEFFEQFFVQ
jgi:hypothetical protein